MGKNLLFSGKSRYQKAFAAFAGEDRMKTQTKSISAGKSNGRFYTPPLIVRNILDLCGYAGDAVGEKHVIDNSCGEAFFAVPNA